MLIPVNKILLVPGDKVVLNSGGPIMTVTSVGETHVHATWMNAGELSSRTMYAPWECLMKLTPVEAISGMKEIPDPKHDPYYQLQETIRKSPS